MCARVVGIDLAASAAKLSGFCLLEDSTAKTALLRFDRELVAAVRASRPALVAIDAPMLGLPRRGRLRAAERALARLGVRFFPPRGMPGMEGLVSRARALRRALIGLGFEVIEVFPGAVKQLHGIKARDRAAIAAFLRSKKVSLERGRGLDELDAVLAAWTASLHLKRATIAVGGPKGIVLPKCKELIRRMKR